MSAEKPEIPFQSPVIPEMLPEDSMLKFSCYPGISCFNACCKNIDIALAPYDILRLKTHLGMTTDEFLPKYTFPYEMDAGGLPGVKLKPVEGGSACQFVTDEGCSIYENRPTACRYYPLGLLSMRKKDSPTDEQTYALVREDHCKGHEEDHKQTIGQYRAEQGLEGYDPATRGWRQLILKKKSAGPAVGRLSEMSLQLFFMASYHIDQFQKFVTSDQFRTSYDLAPDLVEKLKTDQSAVVEFGVRFLKQVLFGEETINEKPNAMEKRVERIKEKSELMKAAAKRSVEEFANRKQGNET